MEHYRGTYTFGKSLSFQPTGASKSNIGNTVELAPGISAVVLDEKVSLCHTSKDSTHMCFWEGDCEFTVDIDGQRVTVNDHDDQEKAFVHNGVLHGIRGLRFDLDWSSSVGDKLVHFQYVVRRARTRE